MTVWGRRWLWRLRKAHRYHAGVSYVDVDTKALVADDRCALLKRIAAFVDQTGVDLLTPVLLLLL
jgi:hypothetical protein